MLTPLLLSLLFVIPQSSAQPPPGILGQPAPSWRGVQWVQHTATDTLDIADLSGKVVYLYFFQSWCPGYHSHGFPTLQLLIEAFQDDPEVAFVAVQTTFEGYTTNTPERAKETAERYKLNIPIGHDGDPHTGSVLMRRYQTGGTPRAIIIDPDGIVRMNHYFIEFPDAVRIINTLKNSASKE